MHSNRRRASIRCERHCIWELFLRLQAQLSLTCLRVWSRITFNCLESVWRLDKCFGTASKDAVNLSCLPFSNKAVLFEKSGTAGFNACKAYIWALRDELLGCVDCLNIAEPAVKVEKLKWCRSAAPMRSHLVSPSCSNLLYRALSCHSMSPAGTAWSQHEHVCLDQRVDREVMKWFESGRRETLSWFSFKLTVNQLSASLYRIVNQGLKVAYALIRVLSSAYHFTLLIRVSTFDPASCKS